MVSAFIKNHPLRSMLLVAFVLRLFSAIFSEGYGMHDDHFLIVESSASWVDGFDYNNWLPWSPGNHGIPEGHSFSYVGINYLFFEATDMLGIVDPKTQMLLNRILHALFSLLIVYFGYKITEKLSNQQLARRVGWILACLWIMPILSVRNLVEMTSIPFLMSSIYLVVSEDKKHRFWWAGMLIGMAVSFRYQIAVFAVAMAAFYFFKREWKSFLAFSAGAITTFVLTQGVVDFFIWGYPFAEFWIYATYNMNEGTTYMENSNYFMYVYVLFGIFLIPMGLFLLFGYLRSAKVNTMLFVATIVFIIFHTMYPNRQERFILTIFPIVLILAMIGLNQWAEMKNKQKLIDRSWLVFWVLNFPLLLFFSFTSTKISRVNAMYSLYQNDMTNEKILVEASGEAKLTMMPKFYGKCWSAKIYERDNHDQPIHPKPVRYDYIFIVGQDNLNQRYKEIKATYPFMELVKVCEPSPIDKVLHTLNPRNANEYIEVWATNERNLAK